MLRLGSIRGVRKGAKLSPIRPIKAQISSPHVVNVLVFYRLNNVAWHDIY